MVRKLYTYGSLHQTLNNSKNHSKIVLSKIYCLQCLVIIVIRIYCLLGLNGPFENLHHGILHWETTVSQSNIAYHDSIMAPTACTDSV